MTNKKISSMTKELPIYMTIRDRDFHQFWKEEKIKEQKRITIIPEAIEYIEKKAVEDFGLYQSSFSMEISKLILECKKREEEKNR